MVPDQILLIRMTPRVTQQGADASNISICRGLHSLHIVIAFGQHLYSIIVSNNENALKTAYPLATNVLVRVFVAVLHSQWNFLVFSGTGRDWNIRDLQILLLS